MCAALSNVVLSVLLLFKTAYSLDCYICASTYDRPQECTPHLKSPPLFECTEENFAYTKSLAQKVLREFTLVFQEPSKNYSNDSSCLTITTSTTKGLFLFRGCLMGNRNICDEFSVRILDENLINQLICDTCDRDGCNSLITSNYTKNNGVKYARISVSWFCVLTIFYVLISW
ncbi:uncharacterized protein LOC126747004 [Anthonomus grandis grandis]|uniref:uncharacterized protein LOC126747004 n=1 Tax=Anthonomus grandis grandis TaxID=2921223 RepID=UPI002165FD89|nr:uncharacterized protein LOC126747004 [Anthonomus grandis grandis]